MSTISSPAEVTVPGANGRGLRHMLSRLRSYLFYIPLIFLYTGVLGVCSLLCSLFDQDGKLQHALAHFWAKLIVRTTGPAVEVIGGNIIDWERPTVFAANHLSAFDTPVLYSALPTAFRIIAKKELFGLPFVGWHLSRSGQIPVDSSNARASFRSLNRAVESIQHGHSIVIFPEGSRSYHGKLLPFMSGPFYLAVKAGVAITPMAIIGTYEMLPMNTFHIMPHRLRLAIGQPIAVEGHNLRDLDALSAKVEAAIRELYEANRFGDDD